jgi:prepilin-type N-terminal cleavage/methylation domain-containing protein
MFRKMRKKNAFTLIELIVCIAILAILALLVVPKVTGFTDQARIAADNEALHTMNHAIKLYCASNRLTNIVGQTSINVVQPVKNGDSVTVITQFLKDKGLLENDAALYFTTGHTYNAVENKVN